MVKHVLIAASLIALAGCPQAPEEDLLAKADTQCLEQQWDAAVDTLRDHLARYPEDAGGHFLLGRAHAALGHLVIAEGEFGTAHALFVKNGRVNPLPRFSDAQYFEFICHVEMCKVYQRQLLILYDLGAGRPALRDRVRQWAQSLKMARAANPDSPELEVFEELLKQARELVQSLPDAPRKPDAPNVVPLA